MSGRGNRPIGSIEPILSDELGGHGWGALTLSRRRRDLAWDGAIALGIGVLAQVQVWTVSGLEGNQDAIAALSFALAVTLLLRRAYPLAVVGAVALYFVITSAAGWNTPDVTFFPSAALIVAAYSVAAFSDTRTGLIGAGLVAFVPVAGFVVGDLSIVEVFFILLFNGASWSAGQLVRTREEEARSIGLRSAALEREAEERTRAAVADERARIARELHDVVSHGLSGMVFAAAGAERVLDRDPRLAQDALRSIQSTGADAAAEMRRLLGMMRGAPIAGSPDALPAIADVDELVARARRSGGAVSLATDGELDALPAGLQLAAYRIVQEGLTNVAKHASGATAQVALRAHGGQLEVEIVDSGAPGAARVSPPGHGIVGMRERVALYGGELEAGPVQPTGFRVVARFPLGPASQG
jgi:signal transduction histidine kinase